MNWMEKIIPTIGLLIGIVFVAIGAILTGGSALKLAMYQPQPVSTYSYQCEFKPVMESQQDQSRMTVEEKAECLSTAQNDEMIRYKQDKKNTIIDGSMFLAVGIVFWIIFRRSRKA